MQKLQNLIRGALAILLLALLLLTCCRGHAAAAGHSNYVATVTFTNMALGTTNGMQITVNGSTRTYTNNVSSSPSTLIARTNSVGWSATNTLTQLAIYSPPGIDTIEAFSTNAIKITSVMDTNLTVTLSSGVGTVTMVTNPWDRLISAYLPYQLIQKPEGRTNAINLLIDAIGSPLPTSKVPTNAPGFANILDTTTKQPVYGEKDFTGPNKHTNASQVWSGGSVVLLIALSGQNFGLSNGTIDVARLTNVFGLAGAVHQLIGGVWSNAVMDGIRGTNLYGLAGAVHQLIGGRWSNGIMDSPFIINGNVSNLTVSGGAITGSVVMLVGDVGGTSFFSLRSSNSTAAVCPLVIFYREKGPTVAVVSNTALFQIVGTGYGTTGDKVSTRIKGVAQETFSDTTSAGALVFEATPPGSITSSEVMRLVSGAVTVTGVFSAPSITNNTITGTNNWNGDMAIQSRTYGGLGNGNNTGILLGTNWEVEMNGASTIATICSFLVERDNATHRIRLSGAVTNIIANESLAESTDVTRRIRTGTGGDIAVTNQPAWIEVTRRSNRWELMHWTR